MADNLDLVTEPLAAKLATKEITHSGELAHLQAVTLETAGGSPVTLGDASAANQTAGNTLVGAVTEAAPGTDTASSGLNGRLQRLAQRITSLIALIPAALSGSGNFKVAIVEDTVGSILDTDNSAVVTLNTKSMANGAVTLVPKYVKIAAAGSGNNTILAAVSGKKIRVLAYNFMAAGTVNAKFQDGAGGTDLTGLKYCIANVGLVAPFTPVGWFETSSNTLLNINLSGAIAVGGELVYVEV